MRVLVDFDRCEGHGMCALTAPELFSLDERGSLQVVKNPGPEHRAAAERAVRMCPTLALRITDGRTTADASAP